MKAVNIVLIEDDVDDVDILQEALKDRKIPFEMRVIRDGSAAVEYIRSTTEQPEIIVMDFNLPRVHGREVVHKIRSTERFRKIPILILSTSSLEADIDYAYQAGASKYLVKPATLEAITETVETILRLTGRTIVSPTR
ncbi:MAG TPA: response regulator [Chitinophagaceae bacterium]